MLEPQFNTPTDFERNLHVVGMTILNTIHNNTQKLLDTVHLVISFREGDPDMMSVLVEYEGEAYNLNEIGHLRIPDPNNPGELIRFNLTEKAVNGLYKLLGRGIDDLRSKVFVNADLPDTIYLTLDGETLQSRKSLEYFHHDEEIKSHTTVVEDFLAEIRSGDMEFYYHMTDYNMLE